MVAMSFMVFFLYKYVEWIKSQIIGSFVEKTLTWSKPYLRKFFLCIFMKMRAFSWEMQENVRIFMKMCKNARILSDPYPPG